MTPPDEDGGKPLALTYKHWMQTLEAMTVHPSTNSDTKKLAAMLKALFEINRHDPETIKYMNARAYEAMEATE